MNRDRARELLPIIQAYADGKTIEVRESSSNWITSNVPGFQNYAEYRIKPEAREYTLESPAKSYDLPIGCLLAFPLGSDYMHSERTGNTIKVREVLE